jgi:hypothetical protein
MRRTPLHLSGHEIAVRRCGGSTNEEEPPPRVLERSEEFSEERLQFKTTLEWEVIRFRRFVDDVGAAG